jgi:hypothetical protein
MVPGARLIHTQALGDERVLVVDADNDGVVGALVARLAPDWLVLNVEATMDILEEAFRHAVLGGSPGPDGEEVAP